MAPLSPEALVYDLAFASDPQVSPDGSRVLYTVSRANRQAERGSSHLWLAGIDGSDPRRLTWSGQHNREGRWSPDGRWVAFVSDRPAAGGQPARGWGLFVLPLDGPGEAREVVRHAQALGGLAWSPDGRSIAYTTSVDPANPDEQEPPENAPPRVRVTRRLDYKQDTRGYLDDVRDQVFVVDVDSGQRRQLTCQPVDHAYPQWAPDGRSLAVKVSTHGGLYARVGLVGADAAGGEARLLGPETATLGVWAWSPSGDRVLFAGDTEPTAQTDFFVYEVGTDCPRRLTTDLQCLPDAGFPTVQPPSQPVWLDDHQVLFHAVRCGSSGHYVFDVQTAEVRLERDTRSLSAGFSADAERRYLAQALSSLEEVGEIVVYDRTTDQRRTITCLNSALLAASRPARWERLEVARADSTIEAWLLKPADFDPTRRYPVILDVHGGPHGFYGYGFNPIQQVLATNGFLVVFSNPRGSGSYGRHFANQVRLDWGGEDFCDLMAVMDRVVAEPYADPERTGIWGYSYGGYMTAWTIGQTDRFKASVCGAPCFDLESMFGSSDLSYEWGKYEWGGPPHAASAWYAARSPSSFAHRATTPTLIVHGEADQRCPIGQSEQMFVALKQAGCEVEFVRYPNQSHLMLRVGPPAYRADFLGRILAWFKRHLGDPV